MGYRIYVKDKKTKAHQPGHWSEKKRMEVLTTFLATGSQKYTSAITGVPEPTIVSWRKQEWWKQGMYEIKEESNTQIDSKLTKIMDKALDAVMDRIENGEYMYDPRTGEIRRVPARLRDIQKVAGDTIDKKLLLDKIGRQKEQGQKQQITADHLVSLAKEFARIATGKNQPDIQEVKSVIEGEHHEVFEELGVVSNGLQK
jgi:hypothetical protein